MLNSILASCRAAAAVRPIRGLAAKGERESGDDTDDDASIDDDDDEEDESVDYEDISQPLDVIARRAVRFVRRMDTEEGARARREQALRRASFVVEFGLQHGLPDHVEPQQQAVINEFQEPQQQA